jgi:hypothetical protein
MPDADFDQEEFQSERAELHAARLELARAEESMEGTSYELRIELPATLLRPLDPSP